VTLAPAIYYPHGPIAIRDGTHARLEDITGVKHVLKTRTLPTKDDDLPVICVAHGGETGRALGDNNVGAPKFINELKLLTTLVDIATSDLVLDAGIARKVEEIKETLFTDTTWLELFEAIDGFSVTYHFPRKADVLLCEARMELTLVYKSDWPPYETNWLEQGETTFQLTETADPVEIISEIPTS
jgi:hypothetical protein